jgi:hypothetical protein
MKIIRNDLQDKGIYIPEPTMEHDFNSNHQMNGHKDTYCDPDDIMLLNIMGNHGS